MLPKVSGQNKTGPYIDKISLSQKLPTGQLKIGQRHAPALGERFQSVHYVALEFPLS